VCFLEKKVRNTDLQRYVSESIIFLNYKINKMKTINKIFLLTFLAALIFTTGCTPGKKSTLSRSYTPSTNMKGTQFTVNPSYDIVLREAGKEKRPILLDFYTTWCGPCKWMDQDVFEMEAVANLLNENFVNVKIDAEKGEGPGLTRKFEVNGYPSLVFLNSNGEVVERQLGMTTATKVMEMARRVMEANDAVHMNNEGR